MWKNCIITTERNKGGSFKLDLEIKTEIEQHLETLSHEATNRFLKKESINVCYREVPLTEAFQLFDFKDQVSFSTFYK